MSAWNTSRLRRNFPVDAQEITPWTGTPLADSRHETEAIQCVREEVERIKPSPADGDKGQS